MNRLGRAAILLWIGAFVVRMVWTGGFGWFVQQRMRYPLLIAAIALLVFGAYEAVRGTADESREPSVAKRSVAPGVGWLLVLPFVVLMSVAPTGLGAAAADRVGAYNPVESDRVFEPIDASAGVMEMKVFDFLDRAVWDEDRSLEGVTVRLEGIVVNDPDIPDGFKLVRFLVSCCAADGIPLQVAVSGGPSYENDTWVVADVVWIPPDRPYQDLEGDWIVEAEAVQVTVIEDPPNDPYESPY